MPAGRSAVRRRGPHASVRGVHRGFRRVGAVLRPRERGGGMRRALRWTGGTLAILVLGAAALFVHVWYFKPVRIDWFYDRLFVHFALQQPQFLTYLHVLPASL